MESYILEGTDEEYLIVIKSFDIKVITEIIDRLASSRKEDLKQLAWELEKSLHDDGSRRNSSKARSKDKAKSPDSARGGRKKTANPQHRSKPSP
jgi:hypothetical protein